MNKEKDLNQSQLDFSYLTSPSMIDQKIKHLDIKNYFPMEYSNIFLSISNFLELENKYAIKNYNKKKRKKKYKNLNSNQSSFYFEDYLETNKKNKFSKKNNFFSRSNLSFIFFIFSLIFIFSIRIIHVSLNTIEIFQNENTSTSSLCYEEILLIEMENLFSEI